MCCYVHKTEFHVYQSMDPSEVPGELIDFLENPDMTLLVDVPRRYWKLNVDTIEEMNQTEKDAADAAIEQDILSMQGDAAE